MSSEEGIELHVIQPTESCKEIQVDYVFQMYHLWLFV